MSHVQYMSIDEFSDYYHIEKQYNRPLADLAHHRVGANCHFAAEPLHD